MPGPVPKRDEERIRRNKPDIPTDVIQMPGSVMAPELDIRDPHPMVVDLYNSLAESGQSRFYEHSDWQFARLACHFANDLIKSSRPSSVMLQQVNQMLSSLLVTEGDRRRVRMEVERAQTETIVYHAADYFRQRLTGKSDIA